MSASESESHGRSGIGRVLATLIVGILAGPLHAQERLVIDLDSGREIVNDWTYGFRPFSAISHDEGLLYVFDLGDPLVAMAISIEDGTVVGTYGRGQGEGPGELRQVSDVAATTDGVLVSDGSRVNYWRLDGTLVGSYSLSVPGTVGTRMVCALGDQPVVPARQGILIREASGSWNVVGPGGFLPGTFSGTAASHMTCFGDAAYVLYERLGGYTLDGGVFEVTIPPELTEASRRWRESIKPPARPFPYNGLSHDGMGRLFIATPYMGPGDVVGGIIDPVTGCYRVVTDPDPRTRRLRRVMGVYRDSVIVAGTEVVERVIDGVRTKVVDAGSAHMIALRPLRSIGGEPCPANGVPQAARVLAAGKAGV